MASGGRLIETACPNILTSDIETLSISRFDALSSRGEIIYETSTAETVDDGGFPVGALRELRDDNTGIPINVSHSR